MLWVCWVRVLKVSPNTYFICICVRNMKETRFLCFSISLFVKSVLLFFFLICKKLGMAGPIQQKIKLPSLYMQWPKIGLNILFGLKGAQNGPIMKFFEFYQKSVPMKLFWSYNRVKAFFWKNSDRVFGQKVSKNEFFQLYNKLMHYIFLIFCMKLHQHKG